MWQPFALLAHIERLLQLDEDLDPSAIFTSGYTWMIGHLHKDVKIRLLQDARIQTYLSEHPNEKGLHI